MSQEESEMSVASSLYIISAKLKGIAHLFENQGEPTYADVQWDEIYWGLANVFEGLSEEVKKVAIRCDNEGG